jgi:hypothetical protein
MGFINEVFDENGEFRTDKHYPTKVTKLCDYCQFQDTGYCPEWPKK